MADQIIEVEDEAVVTVDLGDEVAVEGSEKTPVVVEKEEEPEPPVRTRTKAASDEAAESLTKALEAAEAGRKAAEETADAERRRAGEAARIANQRESENKTLREESEGKELTIITRDIEGKTREVEAARAEYVKAMEDGDFTKAADAQVKVSKAASALDRAEAKKADYETGARRPAAATTEGRVVEATPPSLFERYVSSAEFTPKAQAWLRAHPDCVPPAVGGDEEKNAAMMEGHFAAMRQKVARDSADYYRIIEEHIGTRKAEEAEPTPRPKPKTTVPRAQPSAPVTRDPPDNSGAPTNGGRQTVKLNAQQQETALFSYPANPGESEAAWKKRAFGTYATEYVRAMQEGKIGRLTH